MQTQAQLEAEELLDEMKDVDPLTQEEVCFWYGITPEDYPRWVQAGLERELEAISMTARAFRGRKDAESVALVRQLMPDVPSCASGPRNGAMSPSAGACEEKKLGALDGDRARRA